MILKNFWLLLVWLYLKSLGLAVHLCLFILPMYIYTQTGKISIFTFTHPWNNTLPIQKDWKKIYTPTFSHPLNHCNRLNKYPYRQSNNISINMFLQTYLNTYIATLPIHSSAYIYTERQTYSKTILTFSQAYTTTILPYQYT